MKFPKAVLQDAVDNIERKIRRMDYDVNNIIFHENESCYIKNANLFIKKIAKYLDATIVRREESAYHLYRRGVVIVICFDWNLQDELIITISKINK